ncbi:hypothetical protein Droror1_Dr00007681 [Drosera rotundifolia]
MDSFRRSANEQERRKGKRNNEVKVVYISTPMKVKTSASKFKDTVQELTGKYSDVVSIMDERGSAGGTWINAEEVAPVGAGSSTSSSGSWYQLSDNDRTAVNNSMETFTGGYQYSGLSYGNHGFNQRF